MKPSASALPRGFACPASLVLPQEDYKTAEGQDGTNRHAKYEADAREGRVAPAIANLFKHVTRWATETKYAYDVATDTTVKIVRDGHRNYGDLRPFDVPMQIDLVGISDDHIVVIDYKGYERVESARGNKQLLCNALALSRYCGIEQITVAIAYPKLDDPDDFDLDIADLDSFDLDAFRVELRALVESSAKVAANPAAYANTGSHCRYCPAFQSCPKQEALAQSLQPNNLAANVNALLAARTDEDLARLHAFVDQVRLLTKRATAYLYARASERPIPLGNGKMFGPVTKQGNEALDGTIAYETIRELHGQAVADAAVQREATKTGIREALKNVGARGQVAELERTVLDKIRERGGAKRETKTEIGVYVPQQQLRVVNE